MKTLTIIGVSLSLGGVSPLTAQIEDFEGVFTYTGDSSTGTFDYFIDTSADTLTITNPTGRFVSLFTFPTDVTPMVLLAQDNFSVTGAGAAGLSSPSYDFTGSETNLFGQESGDGFYWASQNLSDDGQFNMTVLGAGPQNSPTANLADSTFNSFIRNDGSTGPLNILQIGESSSSYTSEAVPEPSAVLLLGISAMGLMRRRR
ncbi:MAG: PEP-CTERM sorting domain-containing protein [Verrucomicrobiaceae bacterium]